MSEAPAPITEEQVKAALYLLQVNALGIGLEQRMKPFTRAQGESIAALISGLWTQKKTTVIDLAGAMEKITPEMMDAVKDSMIAGLTAGGKAWMERATAAEALLRPFHEVFVKVKEMGVDTEADGIAPVRLHHLRAAHARLENVAKEAGGRDAKAL